EIPLRHSDPGDGRQAEGGVHSGLQQRLPCRQRWGRGRCEADDGRLLTMPSSQTPVAYDDGLRKPWGTIIAFLLPALTLYAGFTAYPAIRTLWNSFHRVLPRREEFIGLANYAELA